MDILIKHLKVAFEYALPERVIQTIHNNAYFGHKNHSLSLRSNMMSRDCYYNLSRKLSKEFSVEEIVNLYLDMKSRCNKDKNVSEGLFQLLAEFNNRVLEIDNDIPVCKREKMLNWREISFELGQDIFTTSFFAYHNVVNERRQYTFDWSPQIYTNDLRLKRLLDRGIAENHFHLGGSTQLFVLSWVALMNHPDRIHRYLYPNNGQPGPLEMNRKGNLSFDMEDRPMSWENRIKYAAWLRAKLFKKIFVNYQQDTKLIDEFLKYDNSIEHNLELERMVLGLRLHHGAVFKQPSGKMACLDYAIRKENLSLNQHSYNRLLSGEREFMYYCFVNSFNGIFSNSEQNLFYLYLLIKNQLRSELIQVNNEVGFANFSIYQDRKDSFWGDLEEYSVESQRLAVNSSMASGAIKSMELRIVPKQIKEELIDGICQLDSFVQFSEENTMPLFKGLPLIDSLDSERRKMEVGILLPFFYTFHFIKGKDNIPNKKVLDGILAPRNHKSRMAAMNATIALSVALEQSDYICSRVRGIDAASFEIGCRPETFATEFRYLRNFVPDSGSGKTKYLSRSFSPKLSATYHVGEDFLDIADGLRAVDEVVRFLQYKRGDRIGHGLVLGIDAKDFYKMKSNRVILSKQDMLDNLVWLLMRSLELDVQIPTNNREMLTNRCLRLFREIYGKCCADNNWDLNISDYYNSWKLRGDHPYCYSNKQYSGVNSRKDSLVSYGASIYQYKQFYICDDSLDVYRYDDKIAGLMYYYHFGYDERSKGAEVEVLEIDDAYTYLMTQMQKEMRRLLSEIGVGIECNLTSNQLIGTFKEYNKHPIFIFNNHVINFQSNTEQLSVSINTDDQGVFDTSLENEYAILVQCMAQMKKDEKRLYSDDTIYDYVNHIRELGLLHTFPLPNLSEY